MERFRVLIHRLGPVRDEEIQPLAAGCFAFLCALAGYFLLLPLRDEAAVALGPAHLPRLFAASLFLTLLTATPLASTFLNRYPAKERGLQLLFRTLSLSVLGFLLLYMAAGAPVASGTLPLTAAQAGVRMAFFLAVSLLNLVAVSALWARSADCFSPEAAARLFGLLGAGATLGQLLGSLAAGALARARLLGGGGGSPSLLPLLASAAMLELAGRAAGRYRAVRPAGSGALAAAAVWPTGAGAGEQPDSSSLQRPPGSSLARTVSGGSKGLGARDFDGSSIHRRASGRVGVLDRLLGSTLQGCRLIRASPYLLHMCAYLALNYWTSSFFYFEKALVVAQVPDAASRTAWFAAINSASAFLILGLQLLATGRVIRGLGLPLSLATLPATAGLLMAGVAARPTPAAVLCGEVLRKTLAYALARPARESLFTVVSREEKYQAKLFMDTVVQRLGDAIAAAAFQALVPSLGFGPSGVAAACVPVCAAWAAVAFRLGQRQQRLSAAVPSQ